MKETWKIICAGVLFVCSTLSYGMDDPVGVLSALPPGKAAEIVIPPGVYKLPASGLLLKDLKNVKVMAKGVVFLATNPQGMAMRIENCGNLMIEGLTIDYDPLPFTQGTLTAIDPDSYTADFTVHEGYPELTEPYCVNRFHLFDGKQHRWKAGAPDYYVKQVERLGPREGRIHLRSNDPGFAFLEIGDRVAFNIRTAHAVNIMDGCDDIHLKDFTVHAGPGAAILVRFAESVGTYEGIKIVPGLPPEGATEERLLSSCADGFNAAYSRKGPLLEGCDFSYMGDDSVNLHGVTLPVLKWEDSRTFLSVRPADNEKFEDLLRAGDEIRFLSEPDYRLVGTAKIVRISSTKASYRKWVDTIKKIWPTFKNSNTASFYRIRLDREVDLGTEGIFIEAFASSAPEYIIRNCYFHDHRARGLRLMTGRGLIESNRFERIKGAAISMGPEHAFWKEAGWVHDVTVRGNTIKDVGAGSYTLGAISVFAHVKPHGAQTTYYSGNRNLRMVGNHIEGCARDGINVSAAQDVIIKGNTVIRSNREPAFSAVNEYGLRWGEPITVQHSGAVVRENNKFK